MERVRPILPNPTVGPLLCLLRAPLRVAPHCGNWSMSLRRTRQGARNKQPP